MNNVVKYSQHNKNGIKDVKHFLSKYKGFFKWRDSKNILEIGCATGTVTKGALYPFVEEHVDKLLATDISQEAIDVASQTNTTPKISFCRMDVEEEHLGNKYREQFGHIFAFSVLHLLKAPDKWSRNLYQMLKPRGQLFATIVVLPHPYVTVTTSQRADESAPWAKYLKQCPDICTDYGPDPAEKVGDILSRAGFSVDVTEMETLTSTFESFDDLGGTLLGANGFLKHIPEDLRDAYEQDFLRRLLECTDRGKDGSYCYPKNYLVVVATKI